MEKKSDVERLKHTSSMGGCVLSGQQPFLSPACHGCKSPKWVMTHDHSCESLTKYAAPSNIDKEGATFGEAVISRDGGTIIGWSTRAAVAISSTEGFPSVGNHQAPFGCFLSRWKFSLGWCSRDIERLPTMRDPQNWR